MSTVKLSWNPATRVALLQPAADAIPNGNTPLPSFHHDDSQDLVGQVVNHVLYHHVRDALYFIGILDMQRVKIVSTLNGEEIEVSLPTVTTQPQAASVNAGATASFNVAGTDGGGDLDIQWQKTTNNGTTWTDLSGATNPTYTTGVLAEGDSGAKFRAKLTNEAGTVYSSVVTLTVSPQGTADTRPRWFNGPVDSKTNGIEAKLTNANKFGSNGGKVGSFTVTTTVGNFGFVAVLNTAGVPTFTDVGSGFTGGWEDMGTVVGADSATYRLFKQDYENANPTGAAWTIA